MSRYVQRTCGRALCATLGDTRDAVFRSLIESAGGWDYPSAGPVNAARLALAAVTMTGPLSRFAAGTVFR